MLGSLSAYCSAAMGNFLAKSAAIDFGIQWSLFAVAAAAKTEKFYDLAGKVSP